MGTYVVGDIHGCYDLWIKLKDRIESQDSEARFILIGDIVDRGKQMYEMINWALNNITSDGKYRMLLGNHEDMKITWWKSYKKFKAENTDSGVDMFYPEDYGFNEFILQSNLGGNEVDEIISFFESLPLIVEEDIQMLNKKQHYVIVHGGLYDNMLNNAGRFNYNLLSARKGIRDILLWQRNYFGNSWGSNTILIHGHTPTISRDLVVRHAVPGLIDFRCKDINVDCGAVFEDGTLGAIRLEDLEEFYADNISIKEESFSYKRHCEYKQDMLINSI